LAEHGVGLQANGLIAPIAGSRYQTGVPRIWAGGDALRGADLVVTAVRDGRDAAAAMLRQFKAIPARVG
jgi:glutamate synthase (NADPH/NADH) small chain